MTVINKDWFEELSSGAPVPGGGGASAMGGAAAASLGMMVGNLTVGKKKYAAVEADVKEYMLKLEKLRDEMLVLIEKDAECFKPLAAAYSLPSSTDEEKAEKEKVMARLQDEYDSCVLYHLLLIAVNYSFHPENPVTGKKRIENFRILLKKEMFRNSLKNVHPENFSMTRKVTLICIQLHLYRMVQLIAGVRHRQRRK